VAIVGGGIAGCSTALHAAEAGARVLLVEANEIGWGASSRNAGHPRRTVVAVPLQRNARLSKSGG
jgi:glycine/D-amino acid oxidase-like deaminating enzyme